MKIYIGIREGKVFDACTNLKNIRTKDDGIEINPSLTTYIEMNEIEFMNKNILVGDTWNYELDDSIKDSNLRSLPKIKKPIDLANDKIQELETRISELEKKIS